MSESAAVFNHLRDSSLSSENVQLSALAEGGKKKTQGQQPRQLLSCTKCRARKVKCDRTKPCSACCARGQPKECQFIAEGGDYAPIQQSYELRKLRVENFRLKDRLRRYKIPIDGDDSDDAESPSSQPGDGSASRAQKRRTNRDKERRFRGPECSDSIYFGSLGLASFINEFASMNVTPFSVPSVAHLAHAMPRGVEMYAPGDLPLYPFGTLFSWSLEECIPQLLHCLPPEEELFGYLGTLKKRVHICFYPHIPTEITRSEVERFLSDATKNTEKCPDMLALIFAALALGSQHCVWDKSGGKWAEGVMKQESARGNVYIAAAMQALRMASFMNRPTLLGIKALIMIGPYLTNSGRFLDAWTLFGTTIRLAQSIGLHRNPKYLNPTPPTHRECFMRQNLWWWMLHMDQQYSMTLGRPLGISGIGDCPPPHELTTDATSLRFGEFVHQFTIVARQILSSDRLTTTKIDEFTDQLRRLLDTMPEMLQFDESWLDPAKEIPEWPLGAMAAVFYCKTHNYLVLLNRQRVDKPPHSHPVTRTPPPSFHAVNAPGSSHSSPTSPTKATLRGRSLVLKSSEDLLTAFLFFYARIPAALMCWIIGQQAFNSAMILIMDAMETGDLSRIGKVERAYTVFSELDRNGVHKLAALAVEKVSWGLNELTRIQDDARAREEHTAALARRLHAQQGQDSKTPRSIGGETTLCSGQVHDTVMGNTGMLLLEDPGLQSFVREAFSPFTWVMPGDEVDGLSAIQPKQQEEEQQKIWNQSPPREKNDLDTLRQRACDLTPARSSEELQGAQRSTQGSAPLRYATFSTAPAQEPFQPQGLTSPTLRTAPTTMMQQTHAHSHVQDAPTGLIQATPPQLRHHSYPSLHQHVPTPLTPHQPYTSMKQEYGSLRLDALCQPPSATYMTTAPGLASSQPQHQLQTLSEAASQTLHSSASPGIHPSVRPSWAARPAAPISHVSEPALGFTHVSSHAQGILGGPHHMAQQNAPSAYQNQYSSSFHLSTAAHEGNASVAAIVGMADHHMEPEGWRRFVASSGAG